MNKKISSNKQKGFTLIELMVSITIIGILTVIAVINFGGTNKKARDGRRMADLEKIRVALEINRQEKGTYPAALSALTTDGYLQAIPFDPKAGFTYLYDPISNYSYSLSAQMENSGSTNVPSFVGCGGVCNYKVLSP